MKRQESTELPRFAVGALAIAGASAANAATVQITFANNYVSSISGSASFTGDITGDGNADVYGGYYVGGSAEVGVRGVRDPLGRASYYGIGLDHLVAGPFSELVAAGVGGGGALHRLASISFTDSRINGGSLCFGDLDITASSAGSSYTVKINRLIFDDASTSAPTGITVTDPGFSEWSATSAVPEPSSLGLLALGAGGLLTRRRRAMAA